MVFKENLIAVVKCNGKIMRESDGCVFLPFGSEYSILLKNKESRRAVVNVEIDGKDVLSGRQLVVEPNSETELKGLLDDSTAKNAFKFIQKTREIADHRGDRVDDGMVRISFRYELPVQDRVIERRIYKDYYHGYPYLWPEWTLTSSIATNNMQFGSAIGASHAVYSSSIGANLLRSSEPKNDEGITVKGSEVNQGFGTTFTRELEQNEKVIVIRLKGEFLSGVYVNAPITVNTRLKCYTCGRMSNSHDKFCSHCGTVLT